MYTYKRHGTRRYYGIIRIPGMSGNEAHAQTVDTRLFSPIFWMGLVTRLLHVRSWKAETLLLSCFFRWVGWCYHWNKYAKSRFMKDYFAIHAEKIPKKGVKLCVCADVRYSAHPLIWVVHSQLVTRSCLQRCNTFYSRQWANILHLRVPGPVWSEDLCQQKTFTKIRCISWFVLSTRDKAIVDCGLVYSF